LQLNLWHRNVSRFLTCSICFCGMVWPVASPQTAGPNLLQNGSFTASLAPWSFNAIAMNYYVYSRQTTSYLEANTPYPGLSFYQDVLPPSSGNDASYEATIQARNVQNHPISLTLVLSASSNSTIEARASATYTLTTHQWRRLSIPPVHIDAHTVDLRLMIVLNTAIDSYDFTEAQVSAPCTVSSACSSSPNLLTNGSFTQNVTGWVFPQGGPNSVHYSSVYDHASPQHPRYGELSTDIPGASISQFVSVRVMPIHAHYGTSLWLRSRSGKTIAYKLALWEFGGQESVANSLASGTLSGTAWKHIHVSHSISETDRTTLRVEMYLLTPNAPFDVSDWALQREGQTYYAAIGTSCFSLVSRGLAAERLA